VPGLGWAKQSSISGSKILKIVLNIDQSIGSSMNRAQPHHFIITPGPLVKARGSGAHHLGVSPSPKFTEPTEIAVTHGPHPAISLPIRRHPALSHNPTRFPLRLAKFQPSTPKQPARPPDPRHPAPPAIASNVFATTRRRRKGQKVLQARREQARRCPAGCGKYSFQDPLVGQPVLMRRAHCRLSQTPSRTDTSPLQSTSRE
jgi:hypothetical protein